LVFFLLLPTEVFSIFGYLFTLTFLWLILASLCGEILPILKTWNCLYCSNRQYEKKRYDKPADIPCLVSELENLDLEVCPHFEKYVTLRDRKKCPNCGASVDLIKHHKREGEIVCHICGFVVGEKTIGQLGRGTRTRGFYDR
jgi:ribosomal protein S27AE